MICWGIDHSLMHGILYNYCFTNNPMLGKLIGHEMVFRVLFLNTCC